MVHDGAKEPQERKRAQKWLQKKAGHVSIRGKTLGKKKHKTKKKKKKKKGINQK